ncbi:MAG: HAMP domain-containing protein [Actinomycetota bacterium]|nr:HAMP domain-containing protein [Actinomycetota bacterium]
MLLLAAYLFRPLREIEGALADLEKGDLGRRLPEERADELAP